ncbi:hypothetical protein GCM10028819_32090 [Spirosoma humi]
MNIQDELSIIQRLTTRPPALFRALRIIGVIVTGISGILMGLQQQGVMLPGFLSIFTNLATLMTGLTTIGVSSLTVDMNAAKAKNAL